MDRYKSVTGIRSVGPVVEFRLTWPFRRDDEDSESPMAYIEIVYEAWSWRSNITSRMSARSAAMIILTSLLKCPNSIFQLQEEASTYVVCLITLQGGDAESLHVAED